MLDVKLIMLTLRILFSKDSTEGFEQAAILEQQSHEAIEQMKKEAQETSGEIVG